MKKYFIAAICLFLSSYFSSEAQTQEFPLKNSWGISLYSDFKVEKGFFGVLDYPTHVPFEQIYVDKMYSFGANASYTIYPFKNCSDHKIPVLTRFVLGGEYNEYGDNKSFLFNAEALIGYTFRFNKIGLEIFTGPKGKFAPYSHSYSSPSYSSEIKEMTVKMYSGGLYWTFGVSLRGEHVGLSVGYNQRLTNDFEHLWSPSNKSEKFYNTPLFNSMTVGLQYYF